MYYENKRQFYIKQYGPVTLVVIISVILIISGIYLTLNPNNQPKLEQAKNNKPKEEVIETSSFTFTKLAEKGTVTGVNGIAVVVKTDDGTEEINLIGVKENSKYTDLSNKIKLDLVGKQVTIDYDEEKTIGGKIYGYIYVDNTLYNETLIANGYCELKAERVNINKLDVLVQAQILARNKMLGIWEY